MRKPDSALLFSVKYPVRIILLIFIAAFAMLTAGSRSHAANLPVYTDSLASGWANWSWGATVDFNRTSPVHSGARSLAAAYTSAWAGLYLAANAPVDSSSYGAVKFRINGGTQGGQRLRVMLADGGYNLIDQGVNISLAAGVWTEISIPMENLGGPAQIGGIVWQDVTGGAQPVFYLDDIVLMDKGIAPPQDPVNGPDLTIDAGADRHNISDDIYGMNFADENLAAELRLPVRRFGGNSTSRYNWQTSMTNTGSDWFYENLQSGDNVSVSTLPFGSTTDQFVEQDQRTETRTILTVPLIGWTVKSDSPRQHPYDSGFKVSKYGAQQSVDPWDTDCGNGIYPNGTQITGNSPYDTSMAIGPDFVSDWIQHLVVRYGPAQNGGVAYYNLDNEPMLWNSTHRDVHPQPATYDEIKNKTYQIAAAVKAADPSAKTLGPVVWGWCAYFYSAADGCGIGPDYQSHNNTPFVPWYLQQMKAYEQSHGVRILDYLDLHYYPQASGVALASAGSSSTQGLRLRSTRSLWDSTYMDESWISDTQVNGVAVRLIPRMRDWVNANYPGTKLAITEYNWGGLESINGALTQADVLGIFGRERLDLATLWSPPSLTQPGAFAFKIYRNYDNAGGAFGDVGVRAVSGNQDLLSVYAAQRTDDNALTILVINKTANPLSSNIRLAGFSPSATAEVYRYSAANLQGIVRGEDHALSDSGFSATLPSRSITLFVLGKAGDAPQTLTITKIGSGDGSVFADSGAISWNGNTGTEKYPSNTTVTLTAVANAGSTFGGWTGADQASGNQCTLTMTSAKSVAAQFNLIPVCSFILAQTSKTYTAAGGKGSVNVAASSSSCAWTSKSNASWITITSGGSGTGSRTLKYSVSRNKTRADRTGTMTIAGQTFTVLQKR